MGTSSPSSDPSSALLRRRDEGEGFTNDISTLLDQNRDDDTYSSLPSLNTTRVTFLCRNGEREKLHLILLLSASRLFRYTILRSWIIFANNFGELTTLSFQFAENLLVKMSSSRRKRP